MKHSKEIKTYAQNTKVANRESYQKSRNKTSIFRRSSIKCFVCDNAILKGGISLMMGCVPYSKTGLPKKIGELMGDGFMIIINENDFLCRRCATMFNYVDKLEVDLDIIKKALTGYLKTKYNLLNSEAAGITVVDTDDTTVLEEVEDNSQFDVSVFLQSTDEDTQSMHKNSRIEVEEVIETAPAGFEKIYAGRVSCEKDSEHLAESLSTSKKTVKFKCSECHQYFESQLEAEVHFNNHLPTSNTEADAGDIWKRIVKQTRYQCHICTFQTVNKIFLEKHLQNHLTKPIYQCSLCTKRFKSRPHLLKHMSLHNIFKCSLCSLKFTEKKELLRHLLVHKHEESKSRQEAVEVISTDVALEDLQHESSVHNPNEEKKDEDPATELMEMETRNNVEDSDGQKNDHSLQRVAVDYRKIEELMEKLHADKIPYRNCNEENIGVSNNNDLEDPNTSTAVNDCQKVVESTSCIGNENNIESVTQIEDSNARHYMTKPDVLLEVENQTELPIAKDTESLKHVTDENTNSLESKEEEDESPDKSKMFICSVCGLKCYSNYELKEHLKMHQASSNRSYECHVCSRIFTSQMNLTRHVEKHGMTFKSISCKLCNQKVIDKMHMRRHMREVHRYFLRCFFCSQEFTSKRELQRHELNHPENATNRCSLCKRRFPTEIRLKIHIKNVHNEDTGDEIYKCDICSKTLSSLSNLRRHLTNHEKSEKNAKCDICSEILTDRLHLRQHTEDVHANVYQCPFCQQTFSNRKMCKIHELTHPEKYVYKCDSCPSSFTDKSGLEKHNSVYHRDPHCRFCDKEITDPIKLSSHERRHEMYKNKFPCEHCAKVFQTPSGLKYHMSTHTGKYAIYCEICGRGVHSEILLEEHKATHTKEARYTCDVCGRCFSAKSTYRLHRKWHDDPLPYRCKFCNRRFKHTSIMAVHVRRAHTGERPYKCPHCHHSFSVSSTLHKHIILHTKNYPFICKYCSKGFTARSKIAMHMARAHGDYEMVNAKPPPCEYKMALKPSEMPSLPEDGPRVEKETFKEDISGVVKFEETVIEEQIIEAGQTIFLFQEGFE